MKDIIGAILLKFLKIFLFFIVILGSVLGAIVEPLALIGAEVIKGASMLLLSYVFSIALAVTIILLINNLVDREDLFSFEDINDLIKHYKNNKEAIKKKNLHDIKKINTFRQS
jgi:uncharacterized membrane protein (DUF106 family)